MSDHGKFCWYELVTSDMEAATKFYTAVVGWGVRDASHDGMAYSIFGVGPNGVAGLMTLPKAAADAGGRPGWLGYIAVDGVDAAVDKLLTLGGKVFKPASDIPGVGRFAVVADPQGAPFVLFHPSPEMDSPPPLDPHAVGNLAWRELMATDWESAWSFYSEMFGWTKDMAVPMDALGTYQTFAVDGVQTGGMMTKPHNLPMPFWTYYFIVDSIGAAVERVNANGGKVINGPMDVPGGGKIIQGLDPQGAMFALHSANA